MKTQPKPLGRLPPESPKERRAVASIGDADVAELKSRVRQFTLPGGVLKPDGDVVTTSPQMTKQLLLGDDG